MGPGHVSSLLEAFASPTDETGHTATPAGLQDGADGRQRGGGGGLQDHRAQLGLGGGAARAGGQEGEDRPGEGTACPRKARRPADFALSKVPREQGGE